MRRIRIFFCSISASDVVSTPQRRSTGSKKQRKGFQPFLQFREHCLGEMVPFCMHVAERAADKDWNLAPSVGSRGHNTSPPLTVVVRPIETYVASENKANSCETLGQLARAHAHGRFCVFSNEWPLSRIAALPPATATFFARLKSPHSSGIRLKSAKRQAQVALGAMPGLSPLRTG